jgi:hypothetical protein
MTAAVLLVLGFVLLLAAADSAISMWAQSGLAAVAFIVMGFAWSKMPKEGDNG